MAVDLGWSYFCEFSHHAKFQGAGMGRTRLSHGGRQKKRRKKKLIDFRGYPSPQLELELSWQVGAKVEQQLFISIQYGLCYLYIVIVYGCYFISK